MRHLCYKTIMQMYIIHSKNKCANQGCSVIHKRGYENNCKIILVVTRVKNYETKL